MDFPKGIRCRPGALTGRFLGRAISALLLVLAGNFAGIGAESQMQDALPAKPEARVEEIHSLVAPLDANMDRIQSLMDKAAAAGAETRYFKVSQTVLQRYRKEVFEMRNAHNPRVMEQTARFLLECANRTELGLSEAIRHPHDTIRVPAVDLQKLEVRDGSFFASGRPVMLAGLCGWASPKDFDYLAAIGCTVYAGEMGPNSVFPEAGQPHEIGALTAVLDAAAQHNLKFDLLLSPHYMPQWAYERWADLDPENRRGNNQFMPWDVRSPHLREVLTNFLDAVLPTVRGKPALLDYDLVNEAWYRPFSNLDPATVADFRQRHPSVKSEAVPEDYTTEQISQFLQWFAGEVRQRDARHPIYVKVLTSQEILCVDREAVGDLLTANGMDSYPAYPDPTGVLAADFAWTLLRLDFHRSLTPDKLILDGEYHPCASAYEMPEAYFRAALWLAALHGKDSTALWVDGRVDDVSIDWHANGVEVLGHSALDFLRLGKEIQAFQKQRADIAVYYGAYHENYRTREEWDAGIREAYLASLFQDVDIGILTEKRVHAGALSRYKVVVVPAGCTPTAEDSQKFANFQRRGGIVVQCPSHTKAQDLWPIIHQVVGDSHTEKLVAADHWGVECRSVMLGHRRLFYLANHNRESVDIQLNSAWSLADTIELRTQTHWQGSQMHMEPLEFRIVQALLNP